MAIAGKTKADIRTAIYDVYGEDSSSNLDFSATMVNTFAQEAAQEFALRSDCLLSSASRARPEMSTSTTGAEGLVLLPTGMYRVNRVDIERHVGDTRQRYTIEGATEEYLRLWYGESWPTVRDSGGIGTSWQNLRWYRKGNKRIGIWPALVVGTTGTVVIWGHVTPDRLGVDTNVSDIPAEYIPGVVYFACRRMAERDADSDAEGKRASRFEEQGAKYVAEASGRRPLDRED